MNLRRLFAIVRQGAAADAPRPHHAGDDRRHPGDAAGAVRLRDQPQPARPADRRSPTRPTPRVRARWCMDMVATGVIEPVGEREHAAGADGRCCAAARSASASWCRRISSAAASKAARRCRCWSTAATPSVQSAACSWRSCRWIADRQRARAADRPGRRRQISVVGFYNPERRSAVNIVPGLIGVILTMTMVLFTGVAIVRERERGNMELLIATPVSSSELMIGKVLPYVGDRPGPDHAWCCCWACGCSTCRSAAACSTSTSPRCC